MISYKIISQELYANLAKLSVDIPSQKSLLIQSNRELIQKTKQFSERTSALEFQLKAQKQNNLELSSQVNELSIQLSQMSQKLILEIDNRKILTEEKAETTFQLKNALKQKTDVLTQNGELLKTISALETAIIVLNRKNEDVQEKQKLLQKRIQEMRQTVQNLNIQKSDLEKNVQKKQKTIQNLNTEVQLKLEILQKIVTQYEVCKEQKLVLQGEIQKFKNSPIPKLQQKIQANEMWISQLTKTINELRQRCVQLQMDRPQPCLVYQANSTDPFRYGSKAQFTIGPKVPYSSKLIAPYTLKSHAQHQRTQGSTAPQPKGSNLMEQTFLANKSRFEETERLKYLSICKQLVQQFNSKLSKIQNEKKSMQERYNSLKLKLNDYQYNEFKYKDKISMYLQKIQRYEKLTQKQQSQMEKLILEFDHEVNNVVKMKQEEVKAKLQEEIYKYQMDLQRLKQEEELTKKLQEQAYQELIKHQQNDDFDYEMLKQLLYQAEQQLTHKSQQLQKIKKQLTKTTKELQKYKESKQSYKQKAITLEEQCYDNSIQIRRLKSIVQQLCQELETKSNQNHALKSTLKNNDNNRTNRSNGDSRLEYGQEFNENLSAKVSARNNISAGQRSGSDQYEYQLSQIDPSIQRRNEVLLNYILPRKCYQEINTPAGPSRVSQHSDQVPATQQYWTRMLKPSMKDSLDSINKSQVSSQSEADQGKEKSLNSGSNSPNGSASSKNWYQSYGIKNLYKERTGIVERFGQRFLLHKNSLQ